MKVVKTLRLNLLNLSKRKLDLLHSLSDAYRKAATTILSTAIIDEPTSKNILHLFMYPDVREKHGLPAQLTADCITFVYANRHRARSFKNVPVSFNVPRTGKFAQTANHNPVMIVKTLSERIALPVRQDKAYERFAKCLTEGYGFTHFALNERGEWRVYVTLTREFEVEEPTPQTRILGIDIGTRFLAAVSIYNPYNHRTERQLYFGKDVAQVKRDIGIRRSNLQSRGTAKARRALDRLRGYELDFTQTRCYQLAHQIVDLAKDFKATIAIEDLRNLCSSKLRRKTDRKVKRMPYFKFVQCLESVAFQNGILVSKVSARHTSQICSRCGKKLKSNRKSQSLYKCSCGFECNADRNASVNIAKRFAKLLGERVQIDTPIVSTQISSSGVPVNAPVRPDDFRVEVAVQHCDSDSGKAPCES